MLDASTPGGILMRHFFLGLALLVLGQLHAAPVPKQRGPLKELTTAMLVGKWNYDWCGQPDGWIEFRENGTYTARHSPDGCAKFFGTFAVSGNTITLTEWGTFDSTPESVFGPSCFKFTLDLGTWPDLSGKSTHSYSAWQEPPEAKIAVKLKK
jgi:hypothetical protein